jgi:transcriptional regulator with XRE-family HTH domain
MWYHCRVAISEGEYLVTTAGDLGAALKQFRMAAGMTQEQAAELEGIGQSYLSLLEGGRKFSPSVTHLLRLLRLVGCEVVVRPRGGHG